MLKHAPRIEVNLHKKWTVRVDEDQFELMREKLSYGQPTLLLRKFLASICYMLEHNRKLDILQYLYETNELILPVIKEKKKG